MYACPNYVADNVRFRKVQAKTHLQNHNLFTKIGKLCW